MASIRKRERLKPGKAPSVSWEARITRKGHPALSKSFDTKKDAIAWATEQEAVIVRGGKVSRSLEKTTVAAAIKEYIEANTPKPDEKAVKAVVSATSEKPKESAKKTSKKYLSAAKKYTLDALSHHLGEYSIEKLTRNLIASFLDQLSNTEIPAPANRTKIHPLFDGGRRRTYSEGTCRKYYFALKTALEWHAAKYDYQLGNRFDQEHVPSAWLNPRERRLEDGEEAKLLEACSGMYKSPEGWRLFIRWASWSAMRSGEIVGMRWDEIDFDNSFIKIPKEREKTRNGRQVPLFGVLMEIMKRLQEMKNPDDPRVFWMLPASVSNVGVGFRRIVKRAGLTDLHVHDLRHEATARLFERTQLQTMEIALITGHTELKTLSRYANLRPKLLADKIDEGIDQLKNRKKVQAADEEGDEDGEKDKETSISSVANLQPVPPEPLPQAIEG